MIIYKITNTVNGKVYIGQTTRSLNKRKAEHLAHAQNGVKTHLYSAIRKYGEHNFIFEEICKANDKQTLNELEIYYINKYNSIECGYNMVDGGNNNVMFIPEVKNRHAEKLRSPETRKNISEGMKRYRKTHPFTEEHRRKLSESAMGNNNFGDKPYDQSISCYCVLENGEIHHFHSYRDAYKWWSTIDNPFDTNAECVYQRKIKQSIQTGQYSYKRKTFNYPVWFRKDGGVNEEVTD